MTRPKIPVKKPECFGGMAKMLDEGLFIEKCLHGRCLENEIHVKCQEASMKKGRSHAVRAQQTMPLLPRTDCT